MGIQVWGGKILFRRAHGSKIAADPACCCEEPCEGCPSELLDGFGLEWDWEAFIHPDATPDMEAGEWAPPVQNSFSYGSLLRYTLEDPDGYRFWWERFFEGQWESYYLSYIASLVCESDAWSLLISIIYTKQIGGTYVLNCSQYWQNANPILLCGPDNHPLDGEIELERVSFVPYSCYDGNPYGQTPAMIVAPPVISIVRNPFP